MISEDEEQDIVEDDVELELVDENDRLDELEIEHWEQVILHEHELEELVGHEHREYELEVDKDEEIHVVEEDEHEELKLE